MYKAAPRLVRNSIRCRKKRVCKKRTNDQSQGLLVCSFPAYLSLGQAELSKRSFSACAQGEQSRGLQTTTSDRDRSTCLLFTLNQNVPHF